MSEEVEPLFLLESLVDERKQFRDIEGFEQIASRALANTFHGGFQAPVSGDHDDFNVGMVMFDVLKEI